MPSIQDCRRTPPLKGSRNTRVVPFFTCHMFMEVRRSYKNVFQKTLQDIQENILTQDGEVGSFMLTESMKMQISGK